jgi:rod shape determining protein RodA
VVILKRLRNTDPFVALPVVLLMLVGLFLIRSATLDSASAFHHSQLRWMLISCVVALPLILIPYTRILPYAPAIYLGGLFLLCLVPIIGPTINNAQRWITLGRVFIQPSEFMKLFTVILLARILRFGRPLKKLKDQVVPMLIIVVPMMLTLKQPDLGTALLFVPVALAVLVVSGASFRNLGLLCLLGVLTVTLVYNFALQPYQKERIRNTFGHSKLTKSQVAGGGYQLRQALMAVGNGGFAGQGHGEGPRTQAGRVPYHHNDFIFAVLGEEHGFLGATFVMGMVLFLTWSVFRVGRRARDPAGRLLCVGVGTLIAFQSLIHAGVNLGLVPTTGMPFPFLSHGGSSLLTYTSAIALVLNVSMNRPAVLIRTSQRDAHIFLPSPSFSER